MKAFDRDGFFEKLKAMLSDPRRVESLLERRREELGALTRRLDRWRRLQGVPFSHLVAHQDLLPPESLRMFHVDPDWIAALVDGACSPGRRSDAFGRVIEEAIMPRLEKDAGAAAATGFLLRSQVVQGWKSLGVNAYAEGSSSPLTALRLQRLAPSVLLGVFDGRIRRLDIHEAPQALHFGLDPGDVKSLRGDDGEPASVRVPVPLRDASLRVIGAASLARAMADKRGSTDAACASDFAFQMIEGVGMVSFVWEPER